MTNQNRKRLYNQLIHITYKPRSKANHQLRAKRANGRGIHSPYLFRFVTTVLNTQGSYYAFEALEAQQPIKQKRSPLTFRKKEPHPVQRMIFRIVQNHQPTGMLEIGNRTGMDTQYMINACPKAICRSFTYSSDSNNEPSLNSILSNLDNLDFVLFNAPIDRKQRMDEFKLCLQKVHDGSLFVVKHIHQTPEQAFTWKLMRNHPEVQASIDLYSLGILFFRNDLPKCKLRIKL